MRFIACRTNSSQFKSAFSDQHRAFFLVHLDVFVNWRHTRSSREIPSDMVRADCPINENKLSTKVYGNYQKMSKSISNAFGARLAAGTVT